MDSSTPARGLFITLEGPDGAGKSVQAERMAQALTVQGHDVTLTREPGGTRLGEEIRSLLLSDGGTRDQISDALLFNAARAQLVREVIGPALDRGGVVICDRFADSTLAYQGYGGGVSLDLLRSVQEIAIGKLQPDLTILLDLPVEVGLARRSHGLAAESNRFERAAARDMGLQERIRQGYLALAAADPLRWRVVDATGEPDTVALEVTARASELAAIGEPSGTLVRMSR